MRFIGGKALIMPYILNLINQKTTGVETVSDLFSGSGIVSKTFKNKGFKIICNDMMYFSYVLLRGSVSLNKKPLFKRLNGMDPIKHLNSLDLNNCDGCISKLFIYENYSPEGGRKYFTENNAIKIDLIRQKIETWKAEDTINDDEYYYLLACLLEAIPYVSNTTGVYGAFLKHWDNRALKDLELKEIDITNNRKDNSAFNNDANKIVADIKCDLAYYDPPYNQRQYLPNYHILETIAKYDNPLIKGVTGLRDYNEQKSLYCRKSEVLGAFDELIKNTNSKYIIMSYNTEGILSQEDICNVLNKYGKKGTLSFQHIDYSRYKNAQTDKDKTVKEILYFIEKEC